MHRHYPRLKTCLMLTPLVLTAGTKQPESFELKQVDNSAESEKVSMKSAVKVRLTGGIGERNFTRKIDQKKCRLSS